jgi:Aspartyl protease
MRALLSILAAAVMAHAVDAAAECKLMRIDEWKLKHDAAAPVLEAVVHRQRIPVLLDTGMALREGALLDRAAAARLGLALRPSPGRAFAGVGVDVDTDVGVMKEITIGVFTRRNWPVVVRPEHHGNSGSLVIGSAFFEDIDLELDLAQDAVRLFKSEACRGVSLAYWAQGRASEAPIWVDGPVSVEVSVNGKPLRAILDSGASTTLLDTATAARLGVTKGNAATQPGRCLQLDSFSIGDERIRNPRLRVADLRGGKYDRPEMVLGADFLRTHRVMVARGERKLFFTYAGGTVFPTGAAEACL